MLCNFCGGSGDGAKPGDRRCSVCNGSGEVCDVCGEPTETGQNICDLCTAERGEIIVPVKTDMETIRKEFERHLPAQKGLGGRLAKLPLGSMVVNDVFDHYMDPETDMLFIGFVFGYRVHEHISSIKAEQSEKTAPEDTHHVQSN